MIQTGIKTRSVIGFLKEYLSVIIIVPAFIGGLWQAMELINISYPFLRFFSISQIVADGVLILSFFLIALLPNALSFILQKMFDFTKLKSVNEGDEQITEEKKEKNRKRDIKNSFITFCILLAVGAIYFLLNMGSKNKVADLNVSVMLATIFIYGLNVLLNFCYVSSDYVGKEIFKFCNILLFFFYLIVGVYFCKQIHNIFLLTDNLDNIQNIEYVLKEKYPNSQSEILYFNDKYIFIKISDKAKNDSEALKPKSKIHIMELDMLFKD